MSTVTCRISEWWNRGGRSTAGNSLALPSHPDLGETPHAQDVMRALGVEYESCWASPVTDSWTFNGCNKIPDCAEPWLTVTVSEIPKGRVYRTPGTFSVTVAKR